MRVNDYGRFSQAYTEKPYGFYKLGFSTTIHKATKKDIQLASNYGKELVSKFHHLKLSLIALEDAREKESLTSHEKVYYIKVGKMYWGKLIISVQQYPFTKNITLVYKYRAKFNEVMDASRQLAKSKREINERRNKHDKIYKAKKEE